MSDTIITLATYTFIPDAYLVLNKLQENNIECSIADEHIIAVNPLLTSAVGGVKVKIFENDLEIASQILKEMNLDSGQEGKKLDEKWALDFDPYDTYCPQCESHQVFVHKTSFLESISAIFSKTRFYCADCGNSWEE